MWIVSIRRAQNRFCINDNLIHRVRTLGLGRNHTARWIRPWRLIVWYFFIIKGQWYSTWIAYCRNIHKATVHVPDHQLIGTHWLGNGAEVRPGPSVDLCTGRTVWARFGVHSKQYQITSIGKSRSLLADISWSNVINYDNDNESVPKQIISKITHTVESQPIYICT